MQKIEKLKETMPYHLYDDRYIYYFTKNSLRIINYVNPLDVVEYQLDKDEIFIDAFVLNTKTKEMVDFNIYSSFGIKDSFPDVFKTLIKSRDIEILKSNNMLKIIDKESQKIIAKIKNGLLEYLDLLNTKTIGDNFLFINNSLKKLTANFVDNIGENFLFSNNTLKKAQFEMLKKIDDNFLENNYSIRSIYAPLLQDYPERFKRVIIHRANKYLRHSLLTKATLYQK